MAVAKSYAELPIVGEPFMNNKRMYVNIRMKNGTCKQVRWYTDKEYNKMYAGSAVYENTFNYKKAFGFDKGYIYIFRYNDSDREFFRNWPAARFALHLGWYLPSTEELPDSLPTGIEAVKLPWEEVSEGTEMLGFQLVKKVVNKYKYPDGNIPDESYKWE